MSLCRGTPPPALPPWLLLLVLTASAATATSGADGDNVPVAPAAAAVATSGSPALLHEPLGESEEDAALDEFLRDSRAGRDNFLRFGKATRDNFMRFGRAGRDNFLRFGKAGRDNFLRFGRADRDNFMRFGKAGRDNFLRFGRAGRDNFLRFGKSYRDNFLRFGRASRDNFLRFGRGEDTDFSRAVRDRSPNNFVRLGRARDTPETDVSLEEDAVAARMTHDTAGVENGHALNGYLPSEAELQHFLRYARDRNFLRFGRARPDNFLRLGRDQAVEEEDAGEQPEPVSSEAVTESNSVVGGDTNGGEEEETSVGAAESDEDHMQRVGRAARPRNLFGRWKMSDLNFIRLGRSAPSATDIMPAPVKRSNTPPRTGRSQTGRQDSNYVDNFIRLGNGKRSDELVRTERQADPVEAEVEAEAEAGTSPAARSKRALRAGDGPRSAADCSPQKPALASSIFADLPLAPLSYYSPLAVGLPNYLFAPELAMLPPGEGPAVGKRGDVGRQGSNFIRLG